MKRYLFAFFALLLSAVPALAVQEIYSGVTDQYIYFMMVDATDHVTPETGLVSGDFTVERSRNGATGTAWTTPTVVEVDDTNAPGVYALLFDEDATITSGNISENMVLSLAASGCDNANVAVLLKRPVVTAGETLTVASGVGSANALQFSGSSTAADNAEIVFATDFATNYNTTLDLWNSNMTHVAGTAANTALATAPTNFGDMEIDANGRVDVSLIEGSDATTIVASTVWDAQFASYTSEDSMGELMNDTANGGRLDLLWDAILDDTGTSGVRLSSGTGSGQISLTSGLLAWNPAWDAEVQSESQDAITASLTAIASAILDADYASPAEDSWLERLVEIGTTVDTVNTIVNDLPQVIDQGTAQSATATTLVLRSAAAFSDDELNDASVLITGGSTGVGQVRKITDYVGSTDTATVAAWTTTPTGTITYQIIPGSGGNTETEITEWVQNSTPAEEFFANQPEVVFGDPSDWATYKGKIDTIDTNAAAISSVPANAATAVIVALNNNSVPGIPEPDSYAESIKNAAVAALSADGKLTSGRLSKIDRIQDTGTVAASSEVSGIALANLTAEKIAPGRTFRVAWEGNRSDNIITLNTWASGTVTLAADFDGSNKSNGLNPGTTISTLDSVTITNQADETTVSTSELRVQQTLTAVNFDVAAIAAAGRFTVLIEVTTSDSQKLSMVGELVVEAP